MPIYSIKDYQTYHARQVLNVYWYQGAAGGVAEDVGNAFISDVLPHILNVQTTGITHQRLVVEAFDSITDFAELSVGSTGSIAQNGAPAFVALQYRMNRTTKLTRHGQKRIGGFSEAWIAGETIEAGFIPTAELLATAMADVISLVGGDYVPVIMAREKDVNGVYQLTGEVNLVSSVDFIGLTTQNTRKTGVGV